MAAGYFAFSASWQPNRYAATPPVVPAPQTIGNEPTSASASCFAGLTNASRSGRHASDTASSRLAAASKSAADRSTRPSRPPAKRTGVARAHIEARGASCFTTGTNGARACVQRRASGGAPAPMPTRGGARLRPAAGERRAVGTYADESGAATDRLVRGRQRLLRATRTGHGDDDVGGPDPPRKPGLALHDDGRLGGRRSHRGEDVAGDAGAPHAGDDDGPRPAQLLELLETGFGAGGQGTADLRGRARHRPQHLVGVALLESVDVVEGGVVQLDVHASPPSCPAGPVVSSG